MCLCHHIDLGKVGKHVFSTSSAICVVIGKSICTAPHYASPSWCQPHCQTAINRAVLTALTIVTTGFVDWVTVVVHE